MSRPPVLLTFLSIYVFGQKSQVSPLMKGDSAYIKLDIHKYFLCIMCHSLLFHYISLQVFCA
ncbi:hypothetical protein HanRHA438_Chr17g0813861 [Helianthus annuus]|nr:hypothetical protein HanRHA438_Chr17g0813861 [Helianthus annuus]